MRDWIYRVRYDWRYDVRCALEMGCFPDTLIHWFVWDCAEHAVRTAEAQHVYFFPVLRESLATKKQWLLGQVSSQELTDAQHAVQRYANKLCGKHEEDPGAFSHALRCRVGESVLSALARMPQDIADTIHWYQDLAVDRKEVEAWQRRRLAYLLEICCELQDDQAFVDFLAGEDITLWENPLSATEIHCFSTRQPHADLILQHHKTVEGRKQNTHHRGPVVIHASLTPNQEHIEIFQQPGTRHTTPWIHPPIPTPYDPVLGRAVATAQLINSRPMIPDDIRRACYPYIWPHTDLYAWVLADVQPLPTPIPMRGMLGVFRSPWPPKS